MILALIISGAHGSPMTGANPMFSLQFENNKIKRLEQGYLRRRVKDAGDAKKADKMAKTAGTKIRNGELTKENLKVIFHWKHESSWFYARLARAFDSNLCEDVRTILKRVQAMVTKGDGGDAVAELLKLKGVQVPTASAFLANIYPKKFTVIDQLALRALGVNDQNIAFYLYYNDECSRLATENRVSKRTLDRALWEWGKTNPPRRARR
jgi:thermostable 8-oxoguanine DNA glycosylase